MRVDPTSRVPIYRQVAEQFREAVAAGRLTVGERLPSVRDLSRRLVVNPQTITRAYAELEREGLVTIRAGVGAFVVEDESTLSDSARRERLAELADRLAREAARLGCTPEQIMAAVAERCLGTHPVTREPTD